MRASLQDALFRFVFLGNLLQYYVFLSFNMPSVRISGELKGEMYFVTLTVKNWYYIFDRHHRFEILEDSFVYCQRHKNLKVYAFVFMLNHLHFIASADNLSAVLNSFKSFVAKECKKNILATEPSVLRIFEEDGKYEFWRKTNYPKIIETESYFLQKKQYIENNPVRKGYVHLPEDWRWSSASKISTRIEFAEV